MAAFKNTFKVYSDTQNLPQNKFNMRNYLPLHENDLLLNLWSTETINYPRIIKACEPHQKNIK